MAHNPQEMGTTVDRLSSGQLGMPPAAAPAPGVVPPAVPPAAAMPPPPPPISPEPANVETAQDAAAAKGSPETEPDKAQKEPIEYKAIKVDGRDYTEQQLKGTLDRYGALNHQNAIMKPIAEVLKGYMQKNPDMTIDQTAAAISKAFESNPTFGNTEQKASQDPSRDEVPQKSNQDVGSALKDWAERNALDELPSGVEELLSVNGNMNNVNSRMDRIEGALRQIMPRVAGAADAMKAQGADVAGTADANRRQSIANNIDRSQQALNIPGEAAPQFETWMGQMGLTLDDFVDADQALQFMQAFDRDIKGQNYDNLRAMTEKRLAYTGGLGSTPTSPAAAGEAPEDARFADMSSKIMQAKGIT